MNPPSLYLAPFLCAAPLFVVAACGDSPGGGATGHGGGGGAEISGSGGGAAWPGGGGPTACGSLADRLTLSTVDLDQDISYRQPGYNGFPRDRRVAFAVQPDGQSQVAWLGDDLAKVHVTPLTEAQARRGADAVIDGIDLSGLVAHDDGFAVLTRRPDPGAAVAFDGDAATNAAFLVRFEGDREKFAAPLTGTAGLDGARDYSNGLVGQLKWNGERYGAYFVVRGGTDYWAAGHYGDKLVYVDDAGARIDGGWAWNCSHNEGIKLLPEPGAFTALCLFDGYPETGLNALSEGQGSVQLANEVTWAGYAGGQFGSVVKLPGGGYLVAWLSRGTVDAGGETQAARDAHDIALLRLTPDRRPDGDVVWITSTPDVEETSLHLAPYGSDRLLLSWGAVEGARCDGATCFGAFGGTHFALIGADGRPLSDDEILAAPPNLEDDIAVFPNGDLGWAFVDPDTDYSEPVRVDALPKKRTITVARLRYCQD